MYAHTSLDRQTDIHTYIHTYVKNAVAAMVAAIPEITIKDEENEFDARLGNEEYKKIHKDAVEYTTLLSKRSMNYLCIIVIISKKD
jgi:hypothetical protein